MIRTALLALLFTTMAVTPVHAEDKKKDTDELKALNGIWIMEKAEIDGTDATKLFAKASLVIDGEKYALTIDDKEDTGTLKFAPTKSPKELDISGGKTSPLKDKTMLCIYELKDGKLTICYGLDNKTRPGEFSTKASSQRMLAVYIPKK